MPEISLGQLADALNGELHGDPSARISGVSSLDNVQPNTLVFTTAEAMLGLIEQISPAVVLIKPEWSGAVSSPAITVADPYIAYAKASQLFSVRPNLSLGVHPSAYIDATANIGADVVIGANVVIEADVSIGDGCIIGAGSVVGAASSISSGTQLFPNVTIYHGVSIGENCEVSSGAVIGADGFGFAPSASGWLPIAQNGGVKIGNRVFIGANTTIDRGAIDDTLIKDGVIIDNQVQIAHNVTVGENTAIAGCVGIAGSTVIGKNCMIGGGAGLTGHMTICNNVVILSCSRITKSIKEPGEYASGTPFMRIKDWRKAAANYARSVKRTKK